MQSTFAALAALSRRSLDELCQSERSAGDMAERLSLSQPAVAKHLHGLQEADRGGSRGDEPHHRNSLRPQRLAEIDACLAPCRRFWAGRLNALQAYLDQE
jgi:hypothetical protein